MATATTPRPTNFRPSHLSTNTDTPTPTSNHSNSNSLIASLNSMIKPIQPPPPHHQRSHSFNSRPLKPLNNNKVAVNSIINPDDTELQRKQQEKSLERMMNELQHATVESSHSEGTSSASSSSSRRRTRRRTRGVVDEEEIRRNQFQDEERTSSEGGVGTRSSDDLLSEDDEDEEEDGSIRIGLSGVRYAATKTTNTPKPQNNTVPLNAFHHDEEEEEEDVEHDSDDLTYITIPRTETDLDPNSPVKKATTASSPFRNLNGGGGTKNNAPTPYSSSSNVLQQRGGGIPTTSSPATRRTGGGGGGVDENVYYPSPNPIVSPSTRPHQRPIGSSNFSPRPLPFSSSSNNNNLRTVNPPHRSSPLNPLQNSPILASSKSSNGTVAVGGGKPSSQQQPRGERVTIEDVEDQGENPPKKPLNSRSSHPYRNQSLYPPLKEGRNDDEEEEVTKYRLPDLTYLTEALKSPEIVRNHNSSKKINTGGRTTMRNEQEKSKLGSNGSGGSGSSQSKEAPLIAGALSSLTSKLRQLESENLESTSRVKLLEQQLSQLRSSQQQQQRQQSRSTNGGEELRMRREMEVLVEEERKRRDRLESLVEELRRENLNLDETVVALQRQAQRQEDQLRSKQQHEAHKRTNERVEACQVAIELKDEVNDLKFGLQGLGYEVEGVRGVVEGLLRDKEVREGERRWVVEEEDRRKSFSGSTTTAAAAAMKRGGEWKDEQDERPGTPISDEILSQTTTSFVSDAEIERLREEQAMEYQRRTPRRESAKVASKSRPAANVPPRRSHHRKLPSIASSVTSSYDSQQDSTYSPSLRSSVSSSVASTILTAPSESSLSQTSTSSDQVEEPDFERATKIFEDVERAERRERRERVKEKMEREKKIASKGRKSRHEKDRSTDLCVKCLGKKRDEKMKEEREKEKELEREKKAKIAREEREKETAKEKELELLEKKKAKEHEQHCKTLQAVLERLEEDFAVQKKIYLELTVEYQSMGSRVSTKKRRALAEHLKLSIDVLEEKAKDVKQYADALEDLYHTASSPHCQKH